MVHRKALTATKWNITYSSRRRLKRSTYLLQICHADADGDSDHFPAGAARRSGGGSIRTEPPRRNVLIGAPRRMLDGINVTESLRGRRGRQQPRDVTAGKWLKKKKGRGKKWHGRLRTEFIASKRKKQWGEIRPLKTGHTLSVSRGPPPRRLPFRAVAADGESARLGSFSRH